MMSRRFPQFMTIALLLLLAMLLSVSSDLFATSQATYEQMVLKTRGRSNARMLMLPAGGRIVDSIPGQDTYLVDMPKNSDISRIASMITGHPDVEYAHKNRNIDLPEMFQVSQGFPDQKDTVFIAGESPQSYYGQPGIYATGVDSAQTYATGLGVKVAVIDGGLDYSHPLLATATVLPGYDFIDGDTIPAEAAGLMESHGTFVTSLILLTAPDCSIVPLRTFDGDGIGTQFGIAQAINWAINHDVDVINMSFGCDVATPVLTSAIQSANTAGIVMVAAAGNQGSDMQLYPARVNEVIAVAAIDTTELRASFSNYGNHIAICAPGVSLHGAFIHDTYDWGIWSGTSFSAPIVTGAAALIKQLQQGYNSDDVQFLLKMTARTDLAWGSVTVPDSEYGFGLLDALSAVLGAGN